MGALMVRSVGSGDARPTVSPWLTTTTSVVVGVTPSSSSDCPSNALMKALLPALNSPTTTSRKNASSCSIDVRSTSWSSGVAPHDASTMRTSPRMRRSSRSRSSNSSLRMGFMCAPLSVGTTFTSPEYVFA